MERNLTLAEEEAQAAAERRWETDAALRAEFGDDKAACLALARAEARGVTKTYGGRGLIRVRARGSE